MRTLFLTIVACAVSAISVAAQEVVYRSTLTEQSVETGDLLIVLDPVDDDVRFVITMRNTQTGFERRHEFDGEGWISGAFGWRAATDSDDHYVYAIALR